MITILISMVTKLWKPMLIAGIIGTALVYREVVVHQRNSARAELVKSASQIADLIASNQQFQAAVGECNSKVDSLQADSERAQQALAAQATVAADRAATLVATANTAAAVLGKDQIDSSCKGAIQWANQQGPELGRW
jgi:hypothetical protein